MQYAHASPVIDLLQPCHDWLALAMPFELSWHAAWRVRISGRRFGQDAHVPVLDLKPSRVLFLLFYHYVISLRAFVVRVGHTVALLLREVLLDHLLHELRLVDGGGRLSCHHLGARLFGCLLEV